MPRAILPTRVSLATPSSRVIRNQFIAKQQRNAILARMRSVPGYRNMPIPRQYPRGPEVKTLEVQANAIDVIDTGYTQVLNAIPTGVAQSQRVGRQVYLKSLQLNVSLISQAATNGQQVRVVVLYDRQANGALPDRTWVFENSLPALPYTMKVRNNDYKDRFVVLRDKLFTVNPLTSQDNIVNYRDYIKIRYSTQYNAGTTGIIGDIVTGSLVIMMFSQNALGANNPKGSYVARLNYTDQ